MARVGKMGVNCMRIFSRIDTRAMVGSIKDCGECGCSHPQRDDDEQQKQQRVELHTDWVMLLNDDSHDRLHNTDADDGEDNTADDRGLYEEDMLDCMEGWSWMYVEVDMEDGDTNAVISCC